MEAYLQWIGAVSNNDVAKAEALTSKERRPDLDLKALCAKVSAKIKVNPAKNTLVREEIDANAAVVVYRTAYKDGKVKYWMDKLLREDGRWKVVPHLTQNITLRDAKP